MLPSALKEEIASRVEAAGAGWLPGDLMAEHPSLGVGGPADVIEIHDPFCLPLLVDFLREWAGVG